MIPEFELIYSFLKRYQRTLPDVLIAYEERKKISFNITKGIIEATTCPRLTTKPGHPLDTPIYVSIVSGCQMCK
jgi:hypothetical protein